MTGRLSDDEVARAISFIYGHVVNSFRGSIAELLLVPSCLRIVRELQAARALPIDATILVGDSVMVGQRGRRGWAKGADIHILAEHHPTKGKAKVYGVGEVKSYGKTRKALRAQLDRHIGRFYFGVSVQGLPYAPGQVIAGGDTTQSPLRITVLPARWKLPRGFHFEEKDNRSFLHVDPADPPPLEDEIAKVTDTDWEVTLRWSQEALSEAAYAIAFWYMERIGEVLFKEGVPRKWSEMTPPEAGVNAAKMMLYYAILRAQTRRENSRAIALYNVYGFGYALGMNFKDGRGRREMLWPEDLREILSHGKTKLGFRIV